MHVSANRLRQAVVPEHPQRPTADLDEAAMGPGHFREVHVPNRQKASQVASQMAATISVADAMRR